MSYITQGPVRSDIVSAVARANRLLPRLDTSVTTISADHPSYLDRVAFDISLVIGHIERSADRLDVLDLGGGFGLFSLAFALLGAHSIIADDFYGLPIDTRSELLEVFVQTGVEVIDCELASDPVQFTEESLDAVTSFHFLEHLHVSPKRLFHNGVKALREGGAFVVAGPNCVNARKRVTVPLGYGKWSSMQEWYEEPVFRGHVREPDIHDLAYITKELGLEEPHIYGRNFLGQARSGPAGWLAKAVDPLLQHFPGLCSDIYAVAMKTG